MNQRNPLSIVFAIVALLVALFMMTTILVGGGNQIGQLCKYLLGAAFAVGLLSPRLAFLVLLFICGYADFIKRLMVVSGRVSSIDLYYVLGIPPVMVASITLSVLLSALMGRQEVKRHQWMLLLVSCLLMAATVAMAARDSGASIGVLLPVIANQGLYALLLFLVPVLFHDRKDILNLLKSVLWFFLPVAIYGVIQKIYGYQDFEISYLKSGMSIEIKQLIFNEVRPFSTLNSATALASICAALGALSAIMAFTRINIGKKADLNPAVALMLSTIYVVGMVTSTGRAAVVILIFAIFGWICFQSRKLTNFLYIVGAVLFIALVLSASLLLSNLDVLQNKITESVGSENEFVSQLTRIGTYSERLMGFVNLVKNPNVWTLFGHGAQSDNDSSLISHDILTGTLIRYGIVTLLAVALILWIAVGRVHRSIFAVKNTQLRSLAAAMLALGLSFLVVSVFAGSVIVVFPVNVFAFLFTSILLLTLQISDQEKLAEPVAAPAAMPNFRDGTRRVSHPFSRSGNPTS